MALPSFKLNSMNRILPSLLVLFISAHTVLAYTLNDRCFSKSKIESIDTLGGHDEQTQRPNDFLYFGIDLESRGSRGAIVYTKTKPGTPVAVILLLAAQKNTAFTPCFDEKTAAQLKTALKNQKHAPRYEHQVAVELIDAEIP